MQNKRGQGMSTNAIILIILGIVVLVVLILGFTMGWDKIAPWLSRNNVDTIVTSCEAACTIGGQYDFCTSGRNLRADVKLKDVTCNYLAEKRGSEFGVSLCPTITCNVVFVNIVPGEISILEQLENECIDDEKVQTLVDDTLFSHTCQPA